MRTHPMGAGFLAAAMLGLVLSVPVLPQTTGQTQATPPDPSSQARPADPKAQPKAPEQKPGTSAKPGMKPVPPIVPATVPPPPEDYVIGPDDVLQVLFWREPQNSAEVIVRPDGLISLPMLNDIKAAGLTPEQLRQQVVTGAQKFIIDPEVSVIVKSINSRKVFITGQVAKPGAYPLGGPTTVLELIVTAGGLGEWANGKDISIMRTENGKPVTLRFNYRDVVKGKNLKQNVLLKPGDMIIVP